MTESTLTTLRRRGVRALALGGWLALLPIALAGGWSVAALGALANLAPTAAALADRHDASARMTVSTLAAILPALLVYALGGHAWQMDAHMYFFVALAALAVLCDWRPIVLAAGLTALHHLVLQGLAPAWVFDDGGSIARVLFHAVAVVLQTAILGLLAVRLARLLDAQDAAVADGARLLDTAEAAQARAEAALAAAQAAEEAADFARRQHRAAERRHAEARRTELVGLAGDFERSVAAVAVAIETASAGLERSAARLDDLSSAAGREAADVAGTSESAVRDICHVAESVALLGRSIASIAAAAEQQRALTGDCSTRTRRSAGAMRALSERADQIGGFIDEIRGLAAKTNLLALNATIEAARAGDAGRGFAVVAGEVKSLAADTERASDSIVAILDDIRSAIAGSALDARNTGDAVDEVAEAAGSIAVQAGEGRLLAVTMEDGAARAAGSAGEIGSRVGRLAASVAAAVDLSSQVRGSVADLSANARTLRGATDAFVHHLREDHAHAA